MWSWVLFVRPSKRRLIDKSSRPHAEFVLMVAEEVFFFDEELCRVKTATPAVTRATTRYLYRGKRLRNMVRCKNITGRSLHDLARMNVM